MLASPLDAPYVPEDLTSPTCPEPLRVGDLTTLLADFDPDLPVYLVCCQDPHSTHLAGRFGWSGGYDAPSDVFLVPTLDPRAYEDLLDPV
jgi:hypothetical protein